MNTAAFFDIDGTLYRDSLMIEHFKKLLKYEVLDQALWHSSLKYTYENWKKRRGNYDDYMAELVDIYVQALKGMDREKMEFVINQVIDLKGDTVYMYTRERIAWHKSQGHLVIFVSGSPDYLVHKMSGKYQITDCIGSKYLMDKNDKFTGDVEKMWDAESKQKALDRFQKKYDIDLSASYAYGDTNGDLSMFQMTGNPIAFNPARELLGAIQGDPKLKNRVKVVVERKDVIYCLSPDVETILYSYE
ncbi:MAG: HAD family hydrolase [Spirochaetia bacterium]